jgi:hypothetical protein
MTTPKIDSYKFGRVMINGETHTKDVIILPDRVIGGWWRKEGHALHPEDLTTVLEAAPDVLVVGLGAYGRMQITPDAREVLETAGIELVSGSTDEACRQYNHLREERKAAAALHLTC